MAGLLPLSPLLLLPPGMLSVEFGEIVYAGEKRRGKRGARRLSSSSSSPFPTDAKRESRPELERERDCSGVLPLHTRPSVRLEIYSLPSQYVTTVYLLCRCRPCTMTTDDSRQPTPLWAHFFPSWLHFSLRRRVYRGMPSWLHAVMPSKYLIYWYTWALGGTMPAWLQMTAWRHWWLPRYTRRRNEKWSQEGKKMALQGCRLPTDKRTAHAGPTSTQ